MLLVEERLFPGDELAAAMSAAAAAAAAAAATAAAGGSDGDGQAADTTTPAPEGGKEAGGQRGRRSSSPGELSDMEGGWGEDGTTKGSLSHLVECMLEVRGREKKEGCGFRRPC